MTEFYDVIQLVKDRLSANPMVHTVIFALSEASDLQKKNIYPLCYINPIQAPYTNGTTVIFELQIGALTQRDMRKEETTTKFEGNDNALYNLNTTFFILNDLMTYLKLQNNEFDIELTGVSAATPLFMSGLNTLDGWSINISLEMANGNIEVC